jgi:D-threo-aldose 1-dehydrogenase
MEISELGRLGSSDVAVTRLGFGCVPIANLYSIVSDEDATATVHAAYDSGIRLFDTAPQYGHGLGEHRLGDGLRWHDRDSLVISSKVGRLLRPVHPRLADGKQFKQILPFLYDFNYSYDAVLRSVEDSLNRLGMHRIDILLVHDIDVWSHGERWPEVLDAFMSSGYLALRKLREEGVVSAIGGGMNFVEACHRMALRGDFDCFLLAGRYTLLEQGALEGFLPLCEERDISLMIGGPYNSGILVTGSKQDPHYNYAPADAAIIEKVRRIEAVCANHHVPLPAAALQFPLAHPRVAAVVPGARSVDEISANKKWFEHAIPFDFWLEMRREGLLGEETPVPLPTVTASLSPSPPTAMS